MSSTFLSLGHINPLAGRLTQEFFKNIPRCPGVYFMHHADGSILYIGKAKCLRTRLCFYKNAKPGSAPEHTLEMIENIAQIRWEEHPTEDAAFLRESELLRAVQPPFNIAGTEPSNYLFIGLRADATHLHFQLTSRPEIAQDYRLFGCYKFRRRTKSGYCALLRLLHAATSEKQRFSFPARITRSSPPYLYSMKLDDRSRTLLPLLESYLAGKSSTLLRTLFARMLENENIPRFMRHSLQDDIEAVREFFRLGPKATFQLKKTHGLRARTISQQKMDALIRLSCELPRKAVS